MSKIKQILTFAVFLVVSLFQTTTHAQFKDYSHRLGISGSYLAAKNEFGGNGFLGRAFSRIQLNNTFDIEFGAGYGWFEGEDYGGNSYKTKILPVELRLMLSPFSGDSWNPYAYAGIGGVGWWLSDPPSDPARPPEDKYEDINFLVPVGIGTEIALSTNVILDATFGWNAIINDWPNGLATNDENLWNHDWDRYISAGLGISFSGSSCDEDDDSDGLGNCKEEEIGTDPKNADTDGDGLKDGEELMDYNTDPLKIDSNGDGLTDYEKVKIYNLDPNEWDNDDDGLSDYDEIKIYYTDAKNPDTDGEGLKDGTEVHTHKTDPNKTDTDIDGLNDYAEVSKHSTNPLKQDTDGGSIHDGVEVKRGTNPLDPNDDVEQIPIAVPIILDGISFETGSAEINSSSEARLQKALKTMDSHPDIYVEIRGYCDNTGARSFNMKLSQSRAESVRNWLINQGVKSSRLSAKGYGPDNPIASNKTAEGRRKNRRIEFVRTK